MRLWYVPIAAHMCCTKYRCTGSECEITVALNAASGFDELVVEENDTPVRAQSRRRHVFVPPTASEPAQSPQLPHTAMEESLLTDRQTDEYQRALTSLRAEVLVQTNPVVGADESGATASGRVPLADEGMLSLHASEV